MNITPELFKKLIEAACGYGKPPSIYVTEDGILEELVRIGGKFTPSGIEDIGDFHAEVEFCGVKFRGVLDHPINLSEPNAMSIDRRNEIAYKILLHRALKDGMKIGESTPRELGNLAKAIDVPIDELNIFMQDIFGALMKRAFSFK